MVAMETSLLLQFTRLRRTWKRIGWRLLSPQRKRTIRSMRGEEGVGRRSERRSRVMRVLAMMRSLLRLSNNQKQTEYSATQPRYIHGKQCQEWTPEWRHTAPTRAPGHLCNPQNSDTDSAVQKRTAVDASAHRRETPAATRPSLWNRTAEWRRGGSALAASRSTCCERGRGRSACPERRREAG